MKRCAFFCVTAILLVAQTGFAQPDVIHADTTVVFRHKLWLYNSSGEIVGDQDSLVSKEYFKTKWVDLQSEAPFGPNTQYICIMQAHDRHAMVYYLQQTKLSPEVIKGISNWPPGGFVMFITEEKNEETGIKEMRGLKVFIK